MYMIQLYSVAFNNNAMVDIVLSSMAATDHMWWWAMKCNLDALRTQVLILFSFH